MVAIKALIGGKKKHHHKKRTLTKKSVHKHKAPRSVSVAKRFCKPGDKKVSKDPLHKCSKVLKSGPHKGHCKVVLSAKGRKIRAQQLARKTKSKKKTKK